MDSLAATVKYVSAQIPELPEFHKYTSLSATQLAVLSIAFNPIFWNIYARSEHRLHFTGRVLGPYLGCCFLALTIFSLGILRDHLFLTAIRASPSSMTLLQLPHEAIGAALVVIGNVLVVSSMYMLGVTGTYLGDYFGILMDARVTGFPFNVTDNPMYYGSTISFAGVSLYYAKPLGLYLTAEVLVMYLIALRFEEPYTAAIYAKRERLRAGKKAA